MISTRQRHDSGANIRACQRDRALGNARDRGLGRAERLWQEENIGDLPTSQECTHLRSVESIVFGNTLTLGTPPVAIVQINNIISKS